MAGALVFLSFGYTEMAGSDMWWHIAAGRELLQTGTLWMVDDWSFSAHGEVWLNHEWLADIIYYGWVSLLGVESLVYWKWLVIVATFILLQIALARSSASLLAGLICASMAAAIAAPFLDVRPHLYSLLLFSVLLVLLLGRGPKAHALRVPLGLFFLLWVNLHGGFFYGLMALGILIFPWRELSVTTFKTALVTGLICVAASMVNPSGFKAFLYPLAYAFDSGSPFRQLGEWLDPFQPGGIASPLFFTVMWFPLFALCYLVPGVRARTGIPWEGLALTGLTLAMALTSRRFIPLYAISLAVLLAPLLGVLLVQLRLQGQRPRVEMGAVALAVLFAFYRMLPYPMAAGPAFHYLTAEYSYPVEVVNYMEVNKLKGNVYALYNWGGYLHWRTDGELKVFIDGRADTLYSDQIYNQYVQVLSSGQGWMEAIEASDADFILWPLTRGYGQYKVRELIASERWVGVYQDSVSYLLARSSVSLPRERKMPSAGPWQQVASAQKSYYSGDYIAAMRDAKAALESIPWHKTACAIVVDGYRRKGRALDAEDALVDCKSYFPTGLLY